MHAVALLTGEYRAGAAGHGRCGIRRTPALRRPQALGFNHVLDQRRLDRRRTSSRCPARRRAAPRRRRGRAEAHHVHVPGDLRRAARTPSSWAASRDNPRADYESPADQLRPRLSRRHAGREPGHPGRPQSRPRLRDGRARRCTRAPARGAGWRCTSRCRACGRSPAAPRPARRRRRRLRAPGRAALAGAARRARSSSRPASARDPAAARPIVTVLSAGSAAVAPYTGDGARFPLETSQFEVIDQRPFETILREHLDAGVAIENFRS